MIQMPRLGAGASEVVPAEQPPLESVTPVEGPGPVPPSPAVVALPDPVVSVPLVPPPIVAAVVSPPR